MNAVVDPVLQAPCVEHAGGSDVAWVSQSGVVVGASVSEVFLWVKVPLWVGHWLWLVWFFCVVVCIEADSGACPLDV